MKLISVSALLAAASFADVITAQTGESITEIIAQPPTETCGTTTYDLLDGGTKIGTFDIIDDSGDTLKIKVDIKENELVAGEDLANLAAFITSIRYKACCGGVCAPNWTTVPYDVADQVRHVDQLQIQQFDCGGEGEEATLVKVEVDIEQPGGIDTFNGIFPAGGRAISFILSEDRGNQAGASYFDATITIDGVVKGTFDGYCVDVGHGISRNVNYEAMAYNYLSVDWNSLTEPIGNIDTPENMDAVAWCVNNWIPGTEYTADLTPAAYTLSSGTLQRAIWYLVGDDQSTSGLESFSEAWALHIKADCLINGVNFVPGCDDYLPIIIVPNNKDKQNQYVQTTFAGLGLPNCVGHSGGGDATAYCVTGGEAETGGDPHFKTFGNTWFEFHGGCDLLLADFPDFANGLGLIAEVRTTTRYSYSYIESAAIKIGNDIFEVSSFGQYILNGISNALLPNMIGGYPVEHTEPRKNQHLFIIDLGDKRNIVIKVFKDLVYVTLNIRHGHNAEFHEGIGMLGSYFNGTRLARDGATILEDDNEYGQEWQVCDTDAKLFMTDRAPQWPTKCEMPNLAERSSRRLGEAAVSLEEATAACAHIKNQQRNDMCVFDVLATADLEVAQGGSY